MGSVQGSDEGIATVHITRSLEQNYAKCNQNVMKHDKAMGPGSGVMSPGNLKLSALRE